MRIYETSSPEQTEQLGNTLAKEFKSGGIIALVGDLGCGKTAFVKGVVDFFGADEVTSPTFTLVNEYNGSLPIYHFDVYRLDNPSIQECDWMDDYLFGDGICLIEWAENVKAILPKETIWIYFEKNSDKGENYREIKIC